MKKKIVLLVLGIFLISSLAGCGNKVPAGTVATVNGEPISQEELDVNYNQFLQLYQFYGYDVAEDDVKVEARNTMLENLINQKLLLQEADKRGLAVTDEEVEKEINDLVETSYGGNQSELETAVSQAGMTMDYFKQSKKEESIITKLQEDLANNPEIVDVIQAKHILVDTEDEANDIIAQLDSGADFSEIAKEKSTDTGSAAEGGELGYFAVTGETTSKMVDEFSSAAQAQEIGEYSKTPVKSQFGYHIILVEDKQSDVNLLDNPDNKYDGILQGIYQYGLQTLAQGLRENAKVEILIDQKSVPEGTNNEQQTANDDNSNANDEDNTNQDANATDQNNEADQDGAAQSDTANGAADADADQK